MKVLSFKKIAYLVSQECAYSRKENESFRLYEENNPRSRMKSSPISYSVKFLRI